MQQMGPHSVAALVKKLCGCPCRQLATAGVQAGLVHHCAWLSQPQQPHQQQLAWPPQRQFWSTAQPLQQQQQQPPKQQTRSEREAHTVLKVYQGKWILPARFLVRAKVFQLIGGGSIGLVLGSLTMEEIGGSEAFALAALAGGMVAGSCSLWYYSRRYVGEMALILPDAQHVRFSVLDFWGNREDVVVPISAMKPPFKGVRKKEVDRLASQLLFPVNVEGCRQFYLSIHAGRLLQPQVFMSLMQGDFDPQQHPPVVAAQQAWQEHHSSSASQQQQQQSAPSAQAAAVLHGHEQQVQQ